MDNLIKNDFWMKKLMKECEVRDDNKDQVLTRADYEKKVQRYKDMGSSEKHLKKLSDHYDAFMEVLGIADPKTRLPYKEAIANFSKSNFEVLEKLIVTHFDIIDTNEDGKISFDEWVTLYKVLNIDTSHARASFDAMDANSDGVVSKEEFFAYTKEFYTSVEDTLKSSILYGPLD